MSIKVCKENKIKIRIFCHTYRVAEYEYLHNHLSIKLQKNSIPEPKITPFCIFVQQKQIFYIFKRKAGNYEINKVKFINLKFSLLEATVKFK